MLVRLKEISELITRPVSRCFIVLKRNNEMRMMKNEKRYLILLSKCLPEKMKRLCLKIIRAIDRRAIVFKRKSPNEGRINELAKILGRKNLVEYRLFGNLKKKLSALMMITSMEKANIIKPVCFLK